MGAKMDTFETGATRNPDVDKYDYEGFLSPIVLEAFAKYMHAHRHGADGNFRDSDNWQKGIPMPRYMKSLWRHFMDAWTMHRREGNWNCSVEPDQMIEALCAIMFNTMGYLHEFLKRQEAQSHLAPSGSYLAPPRKAVLLGP